MNIRFVARSQKLLLKTRRWFQTQIDNSQTKRVVLVNFEIRTVKI